MQLDYDLINGLEEWVGGTYRITDDFYRFQVFTSKGQIEIYHLTGKMIPTMVKVKLNKDEFNDLKLLLWSDAGNNLSGAYGSYRAKSFTSDIFYGEKDAVATKEELNYDYEWSDL